MFLEEGAARGGEGGADEGLVARRRLRGGGGAPFAFACAGSGQAVEGFYEYLNLAATLSELNWERGAGRLYEGRVGK